LKVIIIGGGTVGIQLATHLSKENHDVVLIDREEAVCKRIHGSCDIITLHGNGGNVAVLAQAGVSKADIFIAVTQYDELNMLACMIASKLGAKNRIARVRNEDFFKDRSVLSPEQMGIDLLIDPEEEAANEILRLIEHPFASEVMSFADGRVQLVGIEIDSKSLIVNKNLIEIAALFKSDFRFVSIIRQGTTIIPTGKETIYAGDHIFVIATKETLPALVTRLKLTREKYSRVFIAGGSEVGIRVARKLEQQNFKVKLLEKQKKKSYELSEKLQKTLVLYGSTTDLDLLLEEGLQDADVFVAATNDEEANILSCLLAKNKGTKKTIACVLSLDYFNMISGLDKIDVPISRRLITISKILKFIRGSKILSATAINEDRAEIIEFLVSKESKIIRKPLKDFKFPKNAILGIIIRDENIIIPTGNTYVMPGDKVFVFALSQAIPEVEKIL
jgi:trk system potassium uptake protein TrkA